MNERVTALSVAPSAHASTSRARNASERVTRARFVKRTNSVRSNSVSLPKVYGTPVYDLGAFRQSRRFEGRVYARRGRGQTCGSCDNGSVPHQWREQKLPGLNGCRLNSPMFMGSPDTAWALPSTWRGPPVGDLRTAAARLGGPVPGRARPLRDVSCPGRQPAGRRGIAPIRRGGVPGVPALRVAGRRVRTVSVYRLRPGSAGRISCKGRGFCPSCGGRRMAERAAHLVDHVFPDVPCGSGS